MSFWRRRFLIGLLLLAAPAAIRARDEAPPAPDAPLMPPAGQKADTAAPPGNGLIEITPEKLQELLDEARLKGRTKVAPTKSRLLDGQVKDGAVLFKAEFEFHAERADTVVGLASKQAKVLAAAQQDGRTPMLSGDADGYLVQVDKPGDYGVTLDLSVPLTQRAGGGRGFELDLPRAAIAYLDLRLPDDARSPRVNGTDAAETSLTLKDHRLEGPLGLLDKVEVSWQGPAPAGVGPLRTARGRTAVRIDGESMTAETELVLHSQGEPVGEWVVAVPPGCEVKASAADLPRVKSLTRGEEPAGIPFVRTGLDIARDFLPGGWPGPEPGAAYTVVLNEPSADDLTLTATTRAPLAGGRRAAVGPFLVRGAVRQFGVVLVGAAAPDVRPVLHPNADLVLRDPTDEERHADPTLTAAYDYAAAPAAPWLEVEAGPAGGSVKTRAAYALTLGRTGPGGALEWQVAAAFSASPLGPAGPARFDVQLPPDCEFLPESSSGVTPDNADPHTLHVRIAANPAGPSAATVAARYTTTAVVPAKWEKAALPLPRPVPSRETQDGGAEIDAAVPDDVELQPPADADVKDPHKFAWRSATTPAEADFSWQAYTPEVHVSSVIDLTFHGQTAEVQHEMHLHFPRAAPRQLTLKVPAAIAGGLQVVSGGVLSDDPPPAPGARVLKLQGAGADQVVTLRYVFAVAPGEKGASLTVPLAAVDPAKDGEARVRVWCGPGRLPAPPGGDWLEQDIEEVKWVPRLPVLVLQCARPAAPLTLAFRDPADAPAVLVDRALFRASLDGDAWEVHAKFLLRQPAGDHLDVELPDAASAFRLRASLDGKEADPETVERPDADGGGRHVARLRLGGDLFLRPAVLELTYRLPARGGLTNTLTPPVLVGDAGSALTRWQVTLPADCVVLAPESGAAARWTVGLRGWLLAPQLAVAGDDLEEWFAGTDLPAAPKADRAPPSLVCWQDAGRPLTVAYLHEGVWMVLCSVPLVFLGLLLFWLVRKAYAGRWWAAFLFWLAVALLAPGAAAAWVFFPTTLYAVAFGCEPGAAVLLAVLLIQALMLERYRRRVVFLPNFRRARTGSSLVRANGARLPTGEPSTVDAPRPAGSSQQPG